MKIQVASFSSTGGAGNVGRHLTYGFKQLGVDASFYSAMESNLRAEPVKLPLVTAAAGFDNYIAKSKDWPSLISLTRDRFKLPLPLDDDTDALILRWGNGFLNQDLITKLGDRTLVLGLDDMNYFTGACHHAGDCTGFHEGCTNCPCVKGTFSKLVQENLERKKRLLGQVKNLKVVAPTQWIKDEFERSSFRDMADVHLISNPIDPIFFEGNQLNDKPKLERESDPLRVLIVAANLDDPIKGVERIWPSLSMIAESGKVEIRCVGYHSQRLKKKMQSAEFLGVLDTPQIVGELRLSDMLLIPSLRENAGTVVAEAAALGVPSIARRIGGLEHEIKSLGEGWLFDEEDQVTTLLLDARSLLSSKLRDTLKDKAMKFEPTMVADQYLLQVIS